MKSATRAGLSLTDHRRKRGYGKTVLVIGAKIVATNVVGILAWEHRRHKAEGKSASNRGRPSKSEVKQLLAVDTRLPRRVASRKIPAKPKAA